jgi:cadmium resistance transport/sequestration family protein
MMIDKATRNRIGIFMDALITTIITAAAAFVATNIDDIFLITLYFSQVNHTLRVRHVVLGQFIGFGAILLVSIVGFLGALIIPEAWIGLLGLFPIYLGVRRLLTGKQDDDDDDNVPLQVAERADQFGGLLSAQTLSVATVTFANGGDNISIYIPLFAGQSIVGIGVIATVFAIGLAALCYLAYLLGSQPTLAKIIRRYEHWLVPIVLIALGVFILVENGTIAMILGWFSQTN